MRKIFIFLISVLIVFSCNRTNDEDEINLFPDSTNYEYKKETDSLIKIIRFFPQTNDTSMVYFYNPKKNIKDSIFYHYNKKGKLIKQYEYFEDMRIRKYTFFYSNGNQMKKITLIDGFLQGDMFYYYPDGKIHKIKEFIQLGGEEHVNNERVFNKSGELNRDSTFYVELKIKKDSISFKDSLKIILDYKIPKNTLARAFTGDLGKQFEISNYKNIVYIMDTVYYYKPTLIGLNTIRIVFEINLTPENANPIIYKSFLEKEIFVTE